MKRIIKIIIGTIAILLVLSVVTAALTPTLASAPFGKKLLIKLINTRIPGTVAIKSLKVTWAQGMSAEDISVSNEEGIPLVQIKKIESTFSLWDYLRGYKNQLGKTTCIEPTLYLETNKKGEFTFEELLGKQSTEPSTALQAGLSLKPLLSAVSINELELYTILGEFEIQNGSILFAIDKDIPLHIAQIEINLQHPTEDSPFTLHWESNTQFGKETGEFGLDLSIAKLPLDEVANIWKDNSLINEDYPDANIELSLRILNLPTEAIEEVIHCFKQETNPLLSHLWKTPFNLVVGMALSEQKGYLNIKGKSQHTALNLRLKGENGQFKLTEDMTLSARILPELVSAYFGSTALSLTEAVDIDLTMQDLNLPMQAFFPDLSKLDIKGKLLCSKVNCTVQDEYPLNLNNTNLQISTYHQTGMHTFNLATEISYKTHKSQWASEASITNLLQTNGKLNKEGVLIRSWVEAKEIPLGLLDHFFSLPFSIEKALGKTLTATFNGNTARGQTDGNIIFQSKKLNTPPIPMTYRDGQLTLSEPVRIEYQIPKELVNEDILETNDLILESDTALALNLQNFSYNLKRTLKKKDLQFNAYLQAKPIFLKEKQFGSFVLRNFLAHLGGDDMNHPTAKFAGKLEQTDQNGLIRETLGSPFEYNLNMDHSQQISLSLKSPNLQTKLDFAWESEDNFKLLYPAKINCTVSPATLNLFGINGKDNPTFQKAEKMTLRLEDLYLKVKNLAQSKLKASAQIPRVTLERNQAQMPGSINDILIKSEYMADHACFDMDITGVINGKTLANPAPFEVKMKGHDCLEGEKFTLEKIGLNIEAYSKDLPLSYVEVLCAKQGKITPYLGSQLDIKLHASLPYNKNEVVDIKIQSPLLNTHASFTVQNSQLKSSLFNLKWIMTPTTYQSLQESQRKQIHLLAPVNFNLSFQDLAIPLGKNKRLWDCEPKILQSNFECKTTIPLINIQSHDHNEALTLRNLQGTITAHDISRILTIDVSGEFSKDPTLITAKDLNLNVNLEHLFKGDGSFNKEAFTLDAKLNSDDFPTKILETFFVSYPDVQESLAALLKDNFTTNLKVKINKLNGPIELNIHSKNMETKLQANLSKGNLSLQTPFQGSMIVNQELSALILGKVNPFLSSAVSADQKLTWELSPQNFHLSLIPLSLESAQIGTFTVHPGKMLLEDTGLLKALLNFLKVRVNSDKKINAWFSPVKISMDKGIMTCERSDILLNESMHIATWGTINLINKKVDLVLGISTKTLSQIYPQVENLKSEFFLLAIGGTIDKAQIDWKRAAAEMATLLASKNAPINIGGLLRLFDKDNKQINQPIPQIQSPLPWLKVEKMIQTQAQKPVQAKPVNKASKKEEALDSLFRLFK